MLATSEDEVAGSRAGASPPRAVRLLHVCVHGCLHAAGRLFLGSITVALLALAALLFALRAGPVEVPLLARVVEQAINDEQEDFRLSVGTAVLRLARRDGQPAIGFRDVSVRSPEGELLIAAPFLGTRFSMPDMMEGRVRVTSLYLRGPAAQVVRGVDGTWRFGLGAWGFGGGVTIASPATDTGDAPAAAAGSATPPAPPQDPATPATPAGQNPAAQAGYAAIARVLEGLAGDAPPVAELERLASVTIRDATLTYRNAATGATWRTENATLRLRRDETGLTAALGLNLPAGSDQQPLRTIRVTAKRERGVPGIEFDASARGLRPGRLGGGIPELDWLGLIDAPIEASLSGRVADDGRVGSLAGRLWAGAGRFVAPGGAPVTGAEFDSLLLSLDFDAVAERLSIGEMSIRAPGGQASLSGIVDLERNADGGLRGLVGQLAVGGIEVTRPDLFAETVRFSTGEIGGRISLQPLTIDIAAARLGEGDLAVDLTGRMRQTDGTWESDLRAEARSLSVDALKRLWPVTFARNARTWVVEHIETGMVETLVAQTRIGRGEPQISLDFRFRDVVSRYLGDMPAIREGVAGAICGCTTSCSTSMTVRSTRRSTSGSASRGRAS